METASKSFRKERTAKIAARNAERQATKREIATCSMWSLGLAPALIGLWAVACFVSGVMNSEGLWNFIQNWMWTVTGN